MDTINTKEVKTVCDIIMGKMNTLTFDHGSIKAQLTKDYNTMSLDEARDLRTWLENIIRETNTLKAIVSPLYARYSVRFVGNVADDPMVYYAILGASKEIESYENKNGFNLRRIKRKIDSLIRMKTEVNKVKEGI